MSILSWALLRFIPTSTGASINPDETFPRPFLGVGSAKFLISESRRLGASEGGDALPGLVSFLEHRAIEEALPFVRLGEDRPDPFAPITLPMPSGAAPGAAFTDDWARAAYNAVPSLSIEGMLLLQGSATASRTASGALQRVRPLASIDVLLYIFLLIPLCARLLVGVPFARAASGELRQEA